jgi:hypothetical protein
MEPISVMAHYHHDIIGVVTIMGFAFGMKFAQGFADTRITTNLFAACAVDSLLNASASHADPQWRWWWA